MEWKIADNRMLFQFEGRILEKNDVFYLGYTNSYIRFFTKGTDVEAYITSNITEEVNMAGLSVFVDDEKEPSNKVVLDKATGWYKLVCLPDDGEHLITVVKVTEAAMSHAGFVTVKIEDGELLKRSFPVRPELKLEFIGDSITCGYGVLGEPLSEYTLREEDGLLGYAQIAADIVGARARFVSASGYGVCVEYTGNREGNIPKLYPYTNWFVDSEVKYDFSEYIPDVVIINLGTNDSGHMHKEDIQELFVNSYAAFLKRIRTAYPCAAILCICGTLCDTMFGWIDQAVDICREDKIEGIYVRRLPYHNVEKDGMASQHPSLVTHRKDGERVAAYIREILTGDGGTFLLSRGVSLVGDKNAMSRWWY
ncbi:MAG: GDSL-type esterase/lipase family protein [Eubacteriales bacterium]|nr:GDSL-type esterase/lipase family protein [Eubacteriales bacterium]